MRRINDPPLPKDTITLYIFSYFSFYVLIHPTILEFGSLYLIDTLAVIPLVFLHWKLFVNFYPKYKKLEQVELNSIDSSSNVSLSELEKKQILSLLISFPQDRMKALFWETNTKTIPVYSLCLYYIWGTPLFWGKLLLLFGIIYIALKTFLYGSYREITRLCSDKIKILHEKYDFSEAIFSTHNKVQLKDNIDLPIKTIVASGFAALVLFYDFDNNVFRLQAVFLFTGYMVYAFLVFYRQKNEDRESLQNSLVLMQTQLAKILKEETTRPLPINMNPDILKTDLFINEMIQELNSIRDEMRKRIELDVIQSRIITVGELSSGIFHDLYTPLQNLRLGLNLLDENPKLSEDTEFLKDQHYSFEQVAKMIDATRGYLRNPTDGDYRTFNEIFVNIITILKSKYHTTKLDKLIVVSEDLNELKLSVNATHATHILFNLVNNALAHLIEAKVENPKIIISLLHDQKVGNNLITIDDNGNGISPEMFARSTVIRMEPISGRGSLGLWLVKRIIERSGGDLRLGKKESKGTLIEWVLPQMQL